MTQQRCVILTTPTLTAKQARLKKNEEERKKNEKEKQKQRNQVDIDIRRGQIALEERKKKELVDLKAKNERALAENEELRRKIASLEAQERQAQERQNDARNTSKKVRNERMHLVLPLLPQMVDKKAFLMVC